MLAMIAADAYVSYLILSGILQDGTTPLCLCGTSSDLPERGDEHYSNCRGVWTSARSGKQGNTINTTGNPLINSVCPAVMVSQTLPIMTSIRTTLHGESAPYHNMHRTSSGKLAKKPWQLMPHDGL